MSLGDVTKCDLSFNNAAIDRTKLINALDYQYNTLLRTIESECKKHTNSYGTDMTHTVSWMISVGGKRIEQLTKQLRKTAELLYTLKESVSRETFFYDGE